MDQLRQQKQHYLRINILDRGYDAEEFMDYCEINHGSVDIDSWTFEQLKKIVQGFVGEKQKDEKFQVPSSTSEPISSEISDQFGQWNNFIEESSPKKQQKQENANIQLNLLDLDFLEGMNSPKQVHSPVKQQKILPPQKSKTYQEKLQKPQKSKQQIKFIPVPHDIAKKLQENNQTFIAAYNQKALHTNTKTQSKIEEPKEQKKQRKIQQPPPTTFKAENIGNSDKFSVKINCKKAVSKCRLTGKEEVTVSGHEIINPNIFVPNYVLYSLTTNPLNIEVKRRMKDFDNLRDLLVRFFPTTQVPHLERFSRLSETDPNTIKKQILFIESFINNILMNEQLKCKLVEEFLFCKDLDLLKKIYKQYEKLKKPNAIESLFTHSGTIQINYHPKNAQFLEKQKTNVDFLESSFSKLKGLYDDLISGFMQNVKILSDITEMYTLIKERIRDVNKEFTPQYQSVDLEKQIGRVQNLHKQWSQSFKTESKIIQAEIRHLFRYERDNIGSLRSLLKAEEQIHESYTKRSDKDQGSIQKYESKRLDDYKLNIETPSKNITVLKYQAGYYQQKASRETLRYLHELSLKLEKKFKLFCKLELNISRDMESVWKQFDSFYL